MSSSTETFNSADLWFLEGSANWAGVNFVVNNLADLGLSETVNPLDYKTDLFYPAYLATNFRAPWPTLQTNQDGYFASSFWYNLSHYNPQSGNSSHIVANFVNKFHTLISHPEKNRTFQAFDQLFLLQKIIV